MQSQDEVIDDVVQALLYAAATSVVTLERSDGVLWFQDLGEESGLFAVAETRETIRLVDQPGTIEPGDTQIDTRWLGDDYAVPTAAGDAAAAPCGPGYAASGGIRKTQPGWMRSGFFTGGVLALTISTYLAPLPLP